MKAKRQRQPLRSIASAKRASVGAKGEYVNVDVPVSAWEELFEARLDAALALKQRRDFLGAERALQRGLASESETETETERQAERQTSTKRERQRDRQSESEKRARLDFRARCAYELSLLYCQQGRTAEADPLLAALGFTYRLGRDVWRAGSDSLSSSSSSSSTSSSVGKVDGVFACHDNVLPAALLSKILEAFSPTSVFWTEHEYPTDRFFSYNVPLASGASKPKSKSKTTSSSNLIAQLAAYLKPLVKASFPEKNIDDVTSVEWWAHSRPNGPSAGHRLHYDLDESRLRSSEGLQAVADSSIHPLVSSVLYLDDGGASGAPTLIIDHKLTGDSTDRAWMCRPKASRLLLFNGSYLHGVVPYINEQETGSGTRLTLMIGWWGPQVHTTPYAPASLGPNMIMPPKSATIQWPALFRPISGDLLSLSVNQSKLAQNAAIAIAKNIWEPIVRSKSKTSAEVVELSNSNIMFVGNWFLTSKSEINNEIMKSTTFCDESGLESQTVAVADVEDVGWISVEDLKKLRGEK